MTAGKKKRILIVDDSASVRQTLSEIINDHDELEVMATAGDPFQATEQIARETPDAITLDVEMPRMDGITFLRRLMAQRPIPVVVCSSLVGDGTATLSAAIEAGAIDVVAKPTLGVRQNLLDSKIQIQNAVLGATRARLARHRPLATRSKQSADVILPPPKSGAMLKTTETVIVIGASTGGTEALREVLERMPPFAPPIVIVQHMPETFTRAFAQRLNSLCQISVQEARDGDSVIRGRALIAPGGKHMLLTRSGANYRVEVRDGPLVNRHRPSVDVLFRSTARVAGSNAIGVILTGMGDDGARGLKEMRDAGAKTIGQNEESCVVYGMPAEAVKHGGVMMQETLTKIAAKIMKLA